MNRLDPSLIPWKNLIGKRATRSLFDTLAKGLSARSQVHALYTHYEINPEIFEQQLTSLMPSQRRYLASALAIARDYALFREKAFQESRSWHEAAETEPQGLLQLLSAESRQESREWIGFWAQYRQGHWSDLQWVERGVRTHVNFDSTEFFARLLALRPRALVLIHNHPSGLTTPSWTDYRLTEKIHSVARQFGIELKGHWIVGPHSEYWIAPESFGAKVEDAQK
ncbi:MAG: Mov34/MPN/PAD-1 family protein [Bdellovibrionales bacterium]|nr:Mov34/MPN/PAD-1 family protein [Bdellovibrionales bacterium]